MEIAVVGLNHNTASTKIREEAAFMDSEKIEAANYLLDNGIDEAVILSTCNRSEIYFASYKRDIDECIKTVKEFYNNFSGIPEIEKYLYAKKGEEAIYHIYYVAAGLDSIVLGEDQILGQVKDAHELAMDIGSSKKILNKLFREAVSTSKRIKTTLKISEQPLSISYIGVKFIKEKMGGLKGKNVLIIGLGKMGKLALKYILEEDVKNIYMANRSREKLLEITREHPEIIALDYEERYNILKDIDLLITATASPHIVIKADKIGKREKELYIMDLAMPRDVDIDAGRLSGVYLFNIDDLKNISSFNEKRREELSKRAREIVKSDALDFKSWLSTVRVDPVIKSLKEKCSKIEKDTLEYIFRKADLEGKDKKIIEKMVSSALKRLVREPIIKLKEMEDPKKREAYIKVLEELFDLKWGD
ncbi:glutamyl-tRNA reductase [Fonticella tunisiensis]|uniref:Glutamyl-tRNA reductase n=1 Tax=Fonticella tunisiensis TaxID=1096341 RepID=A0A4R7KM53_9CLOT|nr:glutamyl-tRNA reductase [Fonticella tunisiensis]TDT56466.1 glutamyl-tRNA reductase [Fonticella tunisiensis]